MSVKEMQAVNEICRFLAKRDITSLDKQQLLQHCGKEKVDVIIAFGNDIQ